MLFSLFTHRVYRNSQLYFPLLDRLVRGAPSERSFPTPHRLRVNVLRCLRGDSPSRFCCSWTEPREFQRIALSDASRARASSDLVRHAWHAPPHRTTISLHPSRSGASVAMITRWRSGCPLVPSRRDEHSRQGAGTGWIIRPPRPTRRAGIFFHTVCVQMGDHAAACGQDESEILATFLGLLFDALCSRGEDCTWENKIHENQESWIHQEGQRSGT